MKNRTHIGCICALIALALASCSLEDPKAVGDTCDADYILLPSGEQIMPGNESYDVYFQRHLCPQDIPYCRTLIGDDAHEDMRFCSSLKESCPDGTHQYNDKCEWNSVAHCGSHANNCLNTDDYPGWAEARCNKSENCEVISCLETYKLVDNKCKTEDQCCGWYCSNCQNTGDKPYCANINGTAGCSEGCGNIDMIICNNVCVNPKTSTTFCGSTLCEMHRCQKNEACVNGQCECAASAIRCGEECVDRNSLETCGACDKRCDAMEGWKSGTCENGTCMIDTCQDGYHIYENKCEADDVDNCGSHGASCHVEKATYACENGACTFTCEPGYHEIDGAKACTSDNLDNCGGSACDNQRIPHGIGFTCEVDTCKVIACASGYHIYDNTCEEDNAANCGKHDNRCTTNHGTPKCENGSCSVASCDDGYHIYSNGCEADSVTNCGAHSKKCSVTNGTPSCSKGACAVDSCDDGFHEYAGDCEENSASDCGEHNYSCTASSVAFATSTVCDTDLGECMATECRDGYVVNTTSGTCDNVVCSSGQHVYGDGCEDDSRENCGKHNEACDDDEICSSGRCISCGSGKHVYDNICESDTTTHCGSHGNSCNVQHATNSCPNGSCVFDCDDGYRPSVNECVQNACTEGDKDCSGRTPTVCNNGEWEYGETCDVLEICSEGDCISCGATNHVYDNECEPNDTVNCGSHDTPCTIENGTGTCPTGFCRAASCNSGYHKYLAMCEENDEDNCGSHGAECSTDKMPGSKRVICDLDTGECQATLCLSGYELNLSTHECEPTLVNTCLNNDDCSTNCCVGGSCVSASLCLSVDLCRIDSDCSTNCCVDGQCEPRFNCVGPAVCLSNSDCATNCCKSGQCVASTNCGSSSTCVFNSDCTTNCCKSGQCVSSSQCSSTTECSSDSDCSTSCCVGGVCKSFIFCHPAEFCAEYTCTSTSGTTTSCCECEEQCDKRTGKCKAMACSIN